MRLLDLVSHYSSDLCIEVPAGAGRRSEFRLPGPATYAARVQACESRYVLSDELVAVCSQLAFAEGDRLSKCLNLVHLPSTTLWLEWSDIARDRAFAELNAAGPPGPPCGTTGAISAGVLVTSSADGRSSVMQTFWSDATGVVSVAPMETHIRLDADWPEAAQQPDSVFSGGLMDIVVPQGDPLADLYECVRFGMNPLWAEYYRQTAVTSAEREHVIRASLATVARDVPVLLAFSLLLAARGALRTRTIDRGRLNRRRLPEGRRPLLDHIEVDSELIGDDDTHSSAEDGLIARRHPRLHRVRGHLFRRGAHVYWRVAHLRGNAALGRVKTRTVTLSIGSALIPIPATRPFKCG